jgi:hypothetical protein
MGEYFGANATCMLQCTSIKTMNRADWGLNHLKVGATEWGGLDWRGHVNDFYFVQFLFQRSSSLDTHLENADALFRVRQHLL